MLDDNGWSLPSGFTQWNGSRKNVLSDIVIHVYTYKIHLKETSTITHCLSCVQTYNLGILNNDNDNCVENVSVFTLFQNSSMLFHAIQFVKSVLVSFSGDEF